MQNGGFAGLSRVSGGETTPPKGPTANRGPVVREKSKSKLFALVDTQGANLDLVTSVKEDFSQRMSGAGFNPFSKHVGGNNIRHTMRTQGTTFPAIGSMLVAKKFLFLFSLLAVTAWSCACVFLVNFNHAIYLHIE